MTANQTETIAGLFMHIMMLRRKLEWIRDTTTDPDTKFQIKTVLQKSLRMPAEEESHDTKGSDWHLD